LQRAIFSEKLRHIFMTKKSNLRKLSIVSSSVPTMAALLGIAVAAISCGHPTGAGPGSACTGSPGAEFCACLAGSTCNSGLMCATDKNECISVVGGGGTTGAAGTSGAGGTTGTAGATGGGTAGTNGTSGIAGTNGTAGTNGIAGTNGTAGTNGAAGTNGSSGSNLVINGDFSMGMTDWAIPDGTPTNPGVTNGQFCLTLGTSVGEVIVGWGDTSTFFAVNTGTNYTLSYQASSTGALSKFEAHVGQVGAPYGIDYTTNNNGSNDTPGAGLTTFTHNFTVTTSDPQAGLAFDMAATAGTPKVCLDNASLTAN
jgi:pilus assembly protein FimV